MTIENTYQYLNESSYAPPPASLPHPSYASGEYALPIPQIPMSSFGISPNSHYPGEISFGNAIGRSWEFCGDPSIVTDLCVCGDRKYFPSSYCPSPLAPYLSQEDLDEIINVSNNYMHKTLIPLRRVYVLAIRVVLAVWMFLLIASFVAVAVIPIVLLFSLTLSLLFVVVMCLLSSCEIFVLRKIQNKAMNNISVFLDEYNQAHPWAEWRLEEEYAEIDPYQSIRQRARVIQIMKLVVTVVSAPPEPEIQIQNESENAPDVSNPANSNSVLVPEQVPEEFRNLQSLD